MRRELPAVLLITALLGGAAGCGPHGKSPATWADQVCGVLAPWQQDERTALAAAAGKQGENAEPAQLRDRLSRALGTAVGVTSAVADHLQSIGAPDVPSGRAAKGELVATVRRTGQSFGDLKDKIDGLDTKDQAAFAKALAPLGDALNAAGGATEDTFQRLDTGEIGKAINGSPACKSLRPNPAGG